jgi:hypothetical protein
MSGFVFAFDSAVDVCQLRGSERRQAQPDGVMHINAIGLEDDQKNKTVVFSLATWQAQFHVTQEMYRAVGPDTDLLLWQDENHRLRDRIIVELIKDTVYPVNCLLRGVTLPAYCPMGLQPIIREAIIGSRTVPTERLLSNAFRLDRGEATQQTKCQPDHGNQKIHPPD